MSKLNINWRRKIVSNFDLILQQYKRYLEDKGFRDSTIQGYLGNVSRYLRFAKCKKPSAQDANDFRELLRSRGLSRSTLNQYAYAIRAFHDMNGESITVKRLSPDNSSPYFFYPDDISRILQECNNIKHLAMISTLFYGALRVSELCNADVQDLEINSATIRIHGKGGKDAIVMLADECIGVLRDYMDIRLEIGPKGPLFLTDFGRRWNRSSVHRMFVAYKKKANVNKRGGVHALRHSAPTLMLRNGMDLATLQQVLRHEDISTTVRYVHVDNDLKREKYKKFMRL